MADGFGPVALVLVPFTRSAVQLWSPLGLLVFEVCLQDVGKEVVIAVPATLIVERNDEEVPPFQGTQHRLAVASPGDGITERAAQPVEDAGVQEELSNVVGEALQDLLDQVVDDVAVVAREPGDEVRVVVSSLHREGSELERTIHPSVRSSNAATSSAPSSRPITSLRYVDASSALNRRSTARISTRSPPRPEPRQRERRVGAGGDQHVDL